MNPVHNMFSQVSYSQMLPYASAAQSSKQQTQQVYRSGYEFEQVQPQFHNHIQVQATSIPSSQSNSNNQQTYDYVNVPSAQSLLQMRQQPYSNNYNTAFYTSCKVSRGPNQFLSHTGGAQAALSSPDSHPDALSTGQVAQKQKTPMALLNELAKYNSLKSEYFLVDEDGPAHHKTFFVKLKLGKEEYQASGLSIKKAQHTAAETALQETKYPKPTQRESREFGHRHNSLKTINFSSQTPMLELHSFVTKLGITPYYEKIQQPHYNQLVSPISLGWGQSDPFSSNNNYNGYGTRSDNRFAESVILRVGHREFKGHGMSVLSAKHNAAKKALRILKAETPVLKSSLPTQTTSNDNTDNGTSNKENAIDKPAHKSDISLLFEIANKRKMAIDFKQSSEQGPPHLKTFTFVCTVDGISCEGEGRSKMSAKKESATKMLALLKEKLGAEIFERCVFSTSAKNTTQLRNGDTRKKIKNVIKEQKADPLYGNQVNPISRLIQITQARKHHDPLYSLLDEKGSNKQREFTIECHLPTTGEKTNGTGPNKKLAKRSAAEGMLDLLGYKRVEPPPKKSVLKTDSQEKEEGGSSGKKVAISSKSVLGKAGQNTQPALRYSQVSTQTVAQIALELIESGQSVTGQTLKPGALLSSRARAEAQLTYLCETIDCSYQFVDETSQLSHGKTQYVSSAWVGVSPGLVLTGQGSSVDEAHNAAAICVLKDLAARASSSR